MFSARIEKLTTISKRKFFARLFHSELSKFKEGDVSALMCLNIKKYIKLLTTAALKEVFLLGSFTVSLAKSRRSMMSALMCSIHLNCEKADYHSKKGIFGSLIHREAIKGKE
ncbi:hypothetical protein [Marinicella meishanensis]|uniref:hypothetical protein n=1 Tax=Marinicella meishanensis TaxID=2873263 RepID=UPI001CBE0D3D|nr:hypothetical protein [Marinicella sp. NBU2979]